MILLSHENAVTIAQLIGDYRVRAGFSQPQAAMASGVGLKTISSFETGRRISSIKLSVLLALLRAYDTDLASFADDLERSVSPKARQVVRAGVLRA